MNICNEEIRQRIVEKGIRYWQVADALGVNDGNFSRMLRHELSDAERMKVLSVIDEVAAEVERDK